MKAILTDIGGTTSPISFTNKTLIEDFSENGVNYIQNASPDFLILTDKIKAEAKLETREEVIDYVYKQIMQKNLKPEYLMLQGLVSIDGFINGRLNGEFFDDVPGSFKRWKENGKGIYTYSNGGKESQRWIFKTAEQGDLSIFIDDYFDTNIIGEKDDADSYKKISDTVEIVPSQMLFLSDVLRELDAADKADYLVHLVVRPGNKPVGKHDYVSISNFNEIIL